MEVAMEEERVTKNPKKVAAGHTGAAARKAKQERVLGEFREVKTSLKGSDNDVHQQKEVTAPKSKPADTKGNQQWLLPAGIGVASLAVVGIVYNLHGRAAPAAPEVQLHAQLKADPFYME